MTPWRYPEAVTFVEEILDEDTLFAMRLVAWTFPEEETFARDDWPETTRYPPFVTFVEEILEEDTEAEVSRPVASRFVPEAEVKTRFVMVPVAAEM